MYMCMHKTKLPFTYLRDTKYVRCLIAYQELSVLVRRIQTRWPRYICSSNFDLPLGLYRWGTRYIYTFFFFLSSRERYLQGTWYTIVSNLLFILAIMICQDFLIKHLKKKWVIHISGSTFEILRQICLQIQFYVN